MKIFECYKCKKYNLCTKSAMKPTEKCFVSGDPDIPKPCNDKCEYYCGKNNEIGDMCSKDGDCKMYYDWFFSKNGWRKIVEPFRKLKKRSNKK